VAEPAGERATALAPHTSPELLVRRFEGFGNLPGDRECFADRDRPARDTPRQVLTFDQLHGEGMHLVRLLEPEDLCDVRVIQRLYTSPIPPAPRAETIS
jgi:hypothetical protein